MSQGRYGILGAGELARSIVSGLCDGQSEPPLILLSPRNAGVAAGLVAKYATVEVATDNQAVLDGSDVVLVCLRQADAPLLADLTWSPEHVVVSAVAGVPLNSLVEMVAPASQAARAVPMPAVATRGSVTPIHPPLPAVAALFDGLGGTLPVEDGDQFEAIFTAMGTVAPFFEYLGVLTRFLSGHGVPDHAARRLIGDTFAGVLAPLGASMTPDFDALVRAHAPPGGGNAQLTELMQGAGVFALTARALETVHQRMVDPTQGADL